MSRWVLVALLSLSGAGTLAHAGPVLDSMDDFRFRRPRRRARRNWWRARSARRSVHLRQGRPKRVLHQQSRGTPAWDKAAGLSFWVKGDGSDHFGGLELIYDDDYAVRYDFAFPLKSTEWTKVVGPLARPCPRPAGREVGAARPGGGNKPSRISALWFGKWWYWGEYPACSFAIDEIRLEEKIDLDYERLHAGGRRRWRGRWPG